MNADDIKQKIIAGTPLTPEELAKVERIFRDAKTNFQWYANDLSFWKTQVRELLEQNRKVFLTCTRLMEQYEATELRGIRDELCKGEEEKS